MCVEKFWCDGKVESLKKKFETELGPSGLNIVSKKKGEKKEWRGGSHQTALNAIYTNQISMVQIGPDQ